MRIKRLLLFLGIFFLIFSVICPAQKIKDAESFSHTDDAATYQVVATYNYPGFKVIQFNLSVLSHYSYLLMCDKEAMVVDPGRDIFTYLKTAKKEGVAIKGVLLTHSHADFVAGHSEMAKAQGCPIYVNAAGKVGYPCTAMKDGDTVAVGQAMVKFVATPGHTPDGMCLFVYNSAKDKQPVLFFSGDTLFVGSVGRPDLLEGQMSAASLASMMYDSWQQKLAVLPSETVVLPAHGAGSLCGAHLSDKPSSTIGEQKISNSYLQHKFRSEFITAVLEGLPEAPQYFKHNAALNRKGPELIDWKANLPDEIKAGPELSDIKKHYVVDIRSAKEYAHGHIPNAVNIALYGRFENWVGIMVPWQADLVLCGAKKELKKALYRLHRVGYRSKIITMESWQKAGLSVSKNSLIQPRQLYELMQQGKSPMVVDVRLPEEWMGLRIGAVLNLPLNHLNELSAKLTPEQPVITVCNSAYRSSMAIGILERNGFTKVSSMKDGGQAWIDAGLPVYKGTQEKSEATVKSQRHIKLPERISATDLQRRMVDLPGTFDLVDIRPAAQFADYHLPGSRNVEIADLLSDLGFLTGAGPLIIVDRDGSLAMAVGGILSQKTERAIKVLYGGLVNYWTESKYKPYTTPGATLKEKSPLPAGQSPAPAKNKPQPAKPQEPQKKRSAGC